MGVSGATHLEITMAKKKSGLAAFRKNNRIVSAKENPPPLEDLKDFIVPGFVGYAATRFVSRVVHKIILNRLPRFARHASVLSTFASAGAAWLAVHRIDKIKEYHTPVVVGSSIAALQSVVQAYFPKYGWIVSDHEGVKPAATPALLTPAPEQEAAGALGAPITSSAATVDDYDDIDMDDLGSLGMGGFEDSEIDDMVELN